MKTLLARLVWGRQARRALAAARADLERSSLDEVTARTAGGGGRRRGTWGLRGFARALGAVLAAEGETKPCLPRAVALLRDARRRGLDPTLVVGVARTGDAAPGLASHAWLELDGVPFLEAPTVVAAYQVIARLPG